MREVLKPENSVVINGWMRNRLGLRGNELMIYAIIYQSSQEKSGDYAGGYRFLAEFTGLSISSVMRITKSMVERGLLTKEIEETINNQTIPHFKAVWRDE